MDVAHAWVCQGLARDDWSDVEAGRVWDTMKTDTDHLKVKFVSSNIVKIGEER